MRTELIGVKLPLHSAMLVRRGAADIGLTKSSYAANLIMRGLGNESADRVPALLGKLEDMLARIETHLSSNSGNSKHASNDIVQLQNQAFMIEVLLLLRYLVRDDLKVKGEIGRKIQKAVGDVRVEGT
jgi:hypothetical protein